MAGGDLALGARISVPKVLIVGSADFSTHLERTMLWADGMERALVSTPGGALEVARAFVPSVVVVDGADVPAAVGLLRRPRGNPAPRPPPTASAPRHPP